MDKVLFKYYNISQNENKDKFIISFSFPLVGEAVNEIYSDIINSNHNIYTKITADSFLDGGAKGKFFEKIVTYHLNIGSKIHSNKKEINYFEEYPIRYHYKNECFSFK